MIRFIALSREYPPQIWVNPEEILLIEPESVKVAPSRRVPGETIPAVQGSKIWMRSRGEQVYVHVAEDPDTVVRFIQEAYESQDGGDPAQVTTHVWGYSATEEDPRDATIVQIDTQKDVGWVRVYLNDGLLYEGNPEVS